MVFQSSDTGPRFEAYECVIITNFNEFRDKGKN
jgi:hypothetical protein